MSTNTKRIFWGFIGVLASLGLMAGFRIMRNFKEIETMYVLPVISVLFIIPLCYGIKIKLTPKRTTIFSPFTVGILVFYLSFLTLCVISNRYLTESFYGVEILSAILCAIGLIKIRLAKKRDKKSFLDAYGYRHKRSKYNKRATLQ